MHHSLRRGFLALCATTAFSALAAASTVPIGVVSFDFTGLPGTATVDIQNQTGPNSSTFPDPTFPVTTSVTLSSLNLVIDFQGGTSKTFSPGSGYFTLAPDGLSYNGATFSISAAATEVILTGSLGPTSFTLNNGTTFAANSTFTATILPSAGATLADGDFAIIDATSGKVSGVPEPGTWMLLAFSFVALALFRYRRLFSSKSIQRMALLLPCLLLISSLSRAATTGVKLNVDTSPSSGVAGTSLVWITGSNFPGTPTTGSVTIELEKACGTTTGETPATPLAVRSVIGTSDRIEFQIPASLATGNYFVTISGTAAGTPFTSINCSEVQVTHSSTALGSCNPGSSMGIIAPSGTSGTVPVTAYVPNGNWGGGPVGFEVVPIEGSGSPSCVTTRNTVNSCSSNSVTGKTVCVANNTDVYIVTGSTVSATLSSGSNAFTSFSGGECENCGVAVNSVTNQAVIQMGFAGAPSGSALQFLDLASNTFSSPVPASTQVSEDILWDPFRNFVLSPDEGNHYNLFQTSGGGLPSSSTVKEFDNEAGTSGEPDSAGEDCTTGIALSTSEFTGQLYIADLTQAKFTAGSPGTWTDTASQVQNFPEFESLSAGTCAIAIAPGSTHLGVVGGEFGGNLVGFIKLPSTSGSGIPSVVDYVVATMPASPDGTGFANGLDPHTTTAYTSPNNGKAYAVLADWATGSPAWVAVVDIQAMLSAPRSGHTVTTIPSGAVRYVSTGSGCGSLDSRSATGESHVNKRITH